MLKRPLLLLLCLAVVASGICFFAEHFYSDQPSEEDRDFQSSQNATIAKSAEETLDQSLRSISLSQGEGGFEIWRLKAEWANVLQQGDRILVEKPKLTYFDKDNENKPLYVNSDKGDIEQKGQILRFVNNVSIMQEDRRLEGELLIYNGTAKTMIFPHGGNFNGTDMNGTADQIVWDIDKKLIIGTGGVRVSFGLQSDVKTLDDPNR